MWFASATVTGAATGTDCGRRPHGCPHGEKKWPNYRRIALETPEMMTDDAKFALGF
jgi:hypothetical protein